MDWIDYKLPKHKQIVFCKSPEFKRKMAYFDKNIYEFISMKGNIIKNVTHWCEEVKQG